jgi:PKD repeat protein
MDFDGDGSADLVSADPQVVLKHTYTAPGLYVAQLTATDNEGSTHTAQVVVEVVNATSVDAMLIALWDGMNSALVAGDKATALSFLTPGAQDKYGPVFDLLLSEMPGIVASYSALQRVAVSTDMGEYALNRTIDGRNRLFLIYFLRDYDGLWRLDAM